MYTPKVVGKEKRSWASWPEWTHYLDWVCVSLPRPLYQKPQLPHFPSLSLEQREKISHEIKLSQLQHSKTQTLTKKRTKAEMSHSVFQTTQIMPINTQLVPSSTKPLFRPYLPGNQFRGLPESSVKLTSLGHRHPRSSTAMPLPVWSVAFKYHRPLILRHRPLPPSLRVCTPR